LSRCVSVKTIISNSSTTFWRKMKRLGLKFMPKVTLFFCVIHIDLNGPTLNIGHAVINLWYCQISLLNDREIFLEHSRITTETSWSLILSDNLKTSEKYPDKNNNYSE
jgi:hypothetical protein